MKIIAIDYNKDLLEIETNQTNEKVDCIYLFNNMDHLYDLYNIVKSDKLNIDFIRRSRIYLDRKSENYDYLITHNSPLFQILNLEQITVPNKIAVFLGLDFDIDVVSILPILK